MKVLSTEVSIAAPVEQVWQVLTNFPNYENWNPFIRQIEGKAEVGEKVKFHIQMTDRELTLDCIIFELIPNQKLRWKWHLFFDRFYRGDHSIILHPHGEHLVHIDHREVYKGWLLLLSEYHIENRIKRGFLSMNSSLKAYCEQLASQQAA